MGLYHPVIVHVMLNPALAFNELVLGQVFPRETKSCECPAILRGVKKPTDCKLFGTVCTPENPMGSCMVSSEGACAAYWTYGRFRDPARQKADAA